MFACCGVWGCPGIYDEVVLFFSCVCLAYHYVFFTGTASLNFLGVAVCLSSAPADGSCVKHIYIFYCFMLLYYHLYILYHFI